MLRGVSSMWIWRLRQISSMGVYSIIEIGCRQILFAWSLCYSPLSFLWEHIISSFHKGRVLGHLSHYFKPCVQYFSPLVLLGLSCIPFKKIHWSPDCHFFRMWTYFGIGSLLLQLVRMMSPRSWIGPYANITGVLLRRTETEGKTARWR